MKFINIKLEVGPEDTSKIRKLLMSIAEHRGSISVKKMVGTKNSQISFYSFSIDGGVLADFMIKLNAVKLKVVTLEEMNEKLVSSVQYDLAAKKSKRIVAEKKISSNKKNIGDELVKDTDGNSGETSESYKRIEEYIAEGNYKYIIEVMKNVQADPDTRKKAELFLPDTVKNAIAITFLNANNGQKLAYQTLDNLVKIATDTQLKNLQLNHLLINAGDKAIEVCDLFPDFTQELIKIGNNVKIPYITSLKSIIKFSNLVIKDTHEYNAGYGADVNFAMKNSNLPWLKLAYDVAGNDIKAEEISAFNKFVSFIEYRKYKN